MGFNRFQTQTALRVLALALTLALAAYLLFLPGYRVTVILLGVAAAGQTVLLLRFVQRTERDLARFFNAVAHEDFEEGFHSTRSHESRQLNRAFARIVADFRAVRAEREAHSQYLRTVVQHIPLGVIAYDAAGTVDLVNRAALRLLGVNDLRALTDLPAAELASQLLQLHDGERRMVRCERAGGALQLAVHATGFRREGKQLTLVSLQNITRELEEKEMEAWETMLRVLTHEIRNSITPIASLASTARQLLEQPLSMPADTEQADDARLAVATIEKRSRGLLQFIEAFSSLTRIPAPRIKTVGVRELFAHVQEFFHSVFERQGVHAVFQVDPETLRAELDPALIEQVLINLILNALEAMSACDAPRLEVKAYPAAQGALVIEVADNGRGILPEVMDRIFIPFFTTKAEGSGIGLSLSRLILRLHHGSIQAQSVPHERTVFTLTLPKA